MVTRRAPGALPARDGSMDGPDGSCSSHAHAAVMAVQFVITTVLGGETQEVAVDVGGLEVEAEVDDESWRMSSARATILSALSELYCLTTG